MNTTTNDLIQLLSFTLDLIIRLSILFFVYKQVLKKIKSRNNMFKYTYLYFIFCIISNTIISAILVKLPLLDYLNENAAPSIILNEPIYRLYLAWFFYYHFTKKVDLDTVSNDEKTSHKGFAMGVIWAFLWYSYWTLFNAYLVETDFFFKQKVIVFSLLITVASFFAAHYGLKYCIKLNQKWLNSEEYKNSVSEE